MKVDISTVPKHLALFVKCLDDSKPANFPADNWINKGQPYRLLGCTGGINTPEESFILAFPGTGDPMKPNSDYWGFRSSRFAFYDGLLPVHLN